MIELTQLDGTQFSLNEHLIEVVLNIPETKVLLTNGKYYLVQESRSEVDRRVLEYERKVYNWHSAGKTGDSRKRSSREEETS
ncbi:MAG: hypothetical protein ACFWUD_04695 [Thermocaproicibacter melissae]|jgi:flagellar protein FlbD|uniref:flagellar FlbD family protein n=1 Tax=Thermocaproicibacter melissae TaxID=2966552 RepID=UPI0024B08BF6|nr:flagellar FlbD family protein [Thermocaproicibacter melissae]WBY64323.1 flagellar FlbD family protein [Thermocaproicibacter melissae]